MTENQNSQSSQSVTPGKDEPHESAPAGQTAVELVSPVSGQAIPIEDVPDPMFSGKVVGDGFGISKPSSGEVLSPVSGKVMMVAKTGHAFALKSDNGLEVLVHLGIDTVELKGEPFTMNVKRGDTIKAGAAVGTMDTDVITKAGKDTTVIVAITNTKKKLASLSVQYGDIQAGEPVAAAEVKPTAPKKAAGTSGAASTKTDTAAQSAEGSGKDTAAANDGAAGTAVATAGATPPPDLTGYDAAAWSIIANIGGKENIRSVTHCITRVRFYLKDQAKANDQAVVDTDEVIEVIKAGGQYQVVIGPAVEDVYDAVVKQLGDDMAGGAADAGEERPKPTTVWGWAKYGFSELIGVITGSMIPVIGLLAASGILKGILSLLITFGAVDDKSSTYLVINAMSDSVFFFLPIFVGFTAARRLGSDPIIVAIIGGVLTYPTVVDVAKNGDSHGSLLGMPLNADFFGLPYHIASYSYSIFPIIVAAWLASVIEPWLKRVIPVTIRMIFMPLIEVFVVSLAVLLILGPIVMLISQGIANGIQALYDLSPTISGLFIGGFYQCLVIFGLHWAVIPLVAQDISATGHSYLNAIISATMVAQGGAVLAVFLKSKLLKIRELSGSAAISAFCGITEPAMYGVNLKYGRVFIMASIGGACGGLLTGLFNVNMWGFTGSLVGFTSFVNPKGLDFSFWGYLIASATALIVSFVLTYFFGFKDSDVEQGREVKKVRLGRRDPVQK